MNKRKDFEDKLQQLAKSIITNKKGFIRLNNHTVTLKEKGNHVSFIVYDDSLKSGKHRFGKMLNKKQTIDFLVEALNGN